MSNELNNYNVVNINEGDSLKTIGPKVLPINSGYDIVFELDKLRKKANKSDFLKLIRAIEVDRNWDFKVYEHNGNNDMLYIACPEEVKTGISHHSGSKKGRITVSRKKCRVQCWINGCKFNEFDGGRTKTAVEFVRFMYDFPNGLRGEVSAAKKVLQLVLGEAYNPLEFLGLPSGEEPDFSHSETDTKEIALIGRKVKFKECSSFYGYLLDKNAIFDIVNHDYDEDGEEYIDILIGSTEFRFFRESDDSFEELEIL